MNIITDNIILLKHHKIININTI